MQDTSPSRWTLRQLPLAARLTVAMFLLSVGTGYFAALMQIHFNHAKAGEPMPSSDDAVNRFHPQPNPEEPPKSRLERLIEAEESLPFNGTGQMSAAFTTKSSGWEGALKKKTRAIAKKRGMDPPTDECKNHAFEELRTPRLGEKLAMLTWIRTGAAREAYEADKFTLPQAMVGEAITADYIEEGDGCRYLKIKSLIVDRCVRCHAVGKVQGKFPLEKYEDIKKYLLVEETSSSVIPLKNLVQTTHVHLLAFSMLYGLTGLILSLTSMPGLVRLVIAPLPLLVQLIDISCWWLARLPGSEGEMFARMIPITGAIVGAGLGLQILLSLFSLFDRWGKAVLILLMLGGLSGTYYLGEQYVKPYLEQEKAAAKAIAEPVEVP